MLAYVRGFYSLPVVRAKLREQNLLFLLALTRNNLCYSSRDLPRCLYTHTHTQKWYTTVNSLIGWFLSLLLFRLCSQKIVGYQSHFLVRFQAINKNTKLIDKGLTCWLHLHCIRWSAESQAAIWFIPSWEVTFIGVRQIDAVTSSGVRTRRRITGTKKVGRLAILQKQKY